MTGMNNALLQLALMLRGHPAMGGGFGSGTSSPFSPNSEANPMISPTLNSWANMPAPHHGTRGGHLPITPAQEIFLGPLNPAWEIPNWEIPKMPEWAGPKPEFFPIPDTGPLPPDTIPPFIPPRAIPYEDDISKLEPDEPVSPIPDDPECEAEWADALDRCNEEFLRLRKKRSGEHKYFDHDRCAKGYVSERCGGNGVDPKPQIRPYKPQA